MYNTIDALAGGDILKHDQIVQMSYQDVYIKLLHNKEVARFQKRYRKILESNARKQ